MRSLANVQGLYLAQRRCRGAPKEQVHHMEGPVEEQHGSERTYSGRLIPVSRDIFAIRVL